MNNYYPGIYYVQYSRSVRLDKKPIVLDPLVVEIYLMLNRFKIYLSKCLVVR